MIIFFFFVCVFRGCDQFRQSLGWKTKRQTTNPREAASTNRRLLAIPVTVAKGLLPLSSRNTTNKSQDVFTLNSNECRPRASHLDSWTCVCPAAKWQISSIAKCQIISHTRYVPQNRRRSITLPNHQSHVLLLVPTSANVILLLLFYGQRKYWYLKLLLIFWKTKGITNFQSIESFFQLSIDIYYH